jgi:hypothetical protein
LIANVSDKSQARKPISVLSDSAALCNDKKINALPKEGKTPPVGGGYAFS